MKLAFLTTIGVPWGGSEILWTTSAEEALAQKHEVLVSVFDWPKQHLSVDSLRNSGAIMIYRRRFYPVFLTRLKKKVFNFFLPFGKKMTYHDYFNRFKADHIFFNLAGGDEIVSDSTDLMLFIEQTSIPYSIFYHSLSTEKYLTEKSASNFKFLLNKATNNFFTSQMQIDLLQEQLDCKIKNARLLNHPLREIKDASASVSKDTVHFCIIGSLVRRWKGQDTVIRILSKEQWCHLNWHLNIYGNGPDKDELEELIASKNLTHKVTITQHTDDINVLFEENDLVLIPSKQDSGPIVLFEAMLAGKPVVGSFMGAMTEYLITEVNGVLAHGTDEISFEIAMHVAWEQKEHWKDWGKRARELMKQRYDFNAAQTLIHLITKSK
jgi:glycosyltransferase involved in cell wall biosynthesis